ncbi:hypothetical protein M9Y10_044677 [Tritrichomonas musculus]|uniref:U1-type domain-containing protein n=1 Tax=Tritrichomonas musculus TaxID=1915356 RepID=A0ABR2JT43_9EUKA
MNENVKNFLITPSQEIIRTQSQSFTSKKKSCGSCYGNFFQFSEIPEINIDPYLNPQKRNILTSTSAQNSTHNSTHNSAHNSSHNSAHESTRGSRRSSRNQSRAESDVEDHDLNNKLTYENEKNDEIDNTPVDVGNLTLSSLFDLTIQGKFLPRKSDLFESKNPHETKNLVDSEPPKNPLVILVALDSPKKPLYKEVDYSAIRPKPFNYRDYNGSVFTEPPNDIIKAIEITKAQIKHPELMRQEMTEGSIFCEICQVFLSDHDEAETHRQSETHIQNLNNYDINKMMIEINDFCAKIDEKRELKHQLKQQQLNLNLEQPEAVDNISSFQSPKTEKHRRRHRSVENSPSENDKREKLFEKAKNETDNINGENLEIINTDIQNQNIEQIEREKQEMERIEREKQEIERIEREKQEMERIEREKQEMERIEREEQEMERIEKEKQESERIKREKQEMERIEREKQEMERIEREKQEIERIEKEKQEAERIKREKQEMERIEREKQEMERIEREEQEMERIEREKQEAERIKREKQEMERIERERLEAERVERERQKAEKIQKEKIEKERIERERKEAERQRREAERLEREIKEKEKIEKEKEKKKENQNSFYQNLLLLQARNQPQKQEEVKNEKLIHNSEEIPNKKNYLEENQRELKSEVPQIQLNQITTENTQTENGLNTKQNIMINQEQQIESPQKQINRSPNYISNIIKEINLSPSQKQNNDQNIAIISKQKEDKQLNIPLPNLDDIDNENNQNVHDPSQKEQENSSYLPHFDASLVMPPHLSYAYQHFHQNDYNYTYNPSVFSSPPRIRHKFDIYSNEGLIQPRINIDSLTELSPQKQVDNYLNETNAMKEIIEQPSPYNSESMKSSEVDSLSDLLDSEVSTLQSELDADIPNLDDDNDEYETIDEKYYTDYFSNTSESFAYSASSYLSDDSSQRNIRLTKSDDSKGNLKTQDSDSTDKENSSQDENNEPDINAFIF